MYEAKVRGLSTLYANGDERIEFHITKEKNKTFPHEYNKRLDVLLIFENDIYKAGIRSTEKCEYIWICPDLKDQNDKSIKLSDIIKKYGLNKNQTIFLDFVSKDVLKIKVIY